MVQPCKVAPFTVRRSSPVIKARGGTKSASPCLSTAGGVPGTKGTIGQY